LPLHLLQFGRILNFLYLLTQLARTSRRKTYSSLFLPLKEAGGGRPK
jgi:hypothetical protein